MGGGACVGGIAEDGRSVRLIAPDAAFNEHFNLDYHVGETWAIEGDPPDGIIPPHTENVVVRRKRRLGRCEELPGLIERHMPPHAGGLDVLYDGLAQGAPGGPLYIAKRTKDLTGWREQALPDGVPSANLSGLAPGVPGYSTMFWRPDRSLVRDTTGKRIRYRYPTDDGGRTLTFVGFQEPPAEIAAGALVRVSLAHWWRPEEHPEVEPRCYLQLSGWIETEFLGRNSVSNPVALNSSSAPSLDEARQTLKRVFGYDDFRPLQADIVANVLARRDSLAVMPTGSGKSLCYQLPALLCPGLTVVVSPLISLMEDQVMQLRQLGIAAAYLNHTVAYEGYIAITQQIRAGRVKLVYAAPETLLRPETLLLLEECGVDCLTIDEAHCISEWGHDFRPEYRQLVQVRRRLPDAVCLAVTATATDRVRRDIKATLDIRDADVFVSSFDRENLFLAVEPRDDGLAQTLDFLESHRGESGIIYCNTRERVDALAARLAAAGWSALPYHAGLDNTARRENQRRFTRDEAAIIVATVAFGMGINKSNVRFVVHHDLPKDIENYYQQIGRAGRDGLPADCLLLFSRGDALTINFLADQGDPTQRAAASARLQAMIAYAETQGCRRGPLLSYFGETGIADNCGRCDNCLAGERELVDLTTPAQKFLSCAVRTDQFFGASHLIDILRGSYSKEVLRRGHDRLSTHGIGREYSKKEWQQLARQFVSSGLLVQDMDHGSLKLTLKGRAVLKGETYMGTPPAVERATRHETARDYDVALFERLREGRAKLARAADLPAMFIFSDASLREMAIYYPQSRESFGQMEGVGAAKLERYGEVFLAIIREYCREKGLAEKRKPSISPAQRARATYTGRTRREEVAALYQQGTSAAEIAEIFDVKRQTVFQHLWETVMAGETIDPEPLLTESRLPAAERERVWRVLDELGAEKLRPVYDALGEAVPWEELHLLRLYSVANLLCTEPRSTKEFISRVVKIGNSGDTTHVPDLIAALNHEDGNVRRLASSALGKLGDGRAVEPLIELLSREQKPQVRQYAVKALGAIGDTRSKSILEKIESDEGEMYYTRKEATDALKQIIQII
jgi:ATP-dependent DNA helicase RecQ